MLDHPRKTALIKAEMLDRRAVKLAQGRLNRLAHRAVEATPGLHAQLAHLEEFGAKAEAEADLPDAVVPQKGTSGTSIVVLARRVAAKVTCLRVTS